MSTSAPTQSDTAIRWGTIGLVAIAGVWTIFHIIWALTGQSGNDYWGTALLILFLVALVLAFLQYALVRPSLIATTPTEQFPEPAISRFFLATTGAVGMWFVIRMDVGAEWFTAGWEKVTSPAWGSSATAIKGFVAFALTKTRGSNPAVQDWYAWFLRNIVLPNAGFFSFLIAWGELAVGLGVLLGALTGIAAGFGVLMNLNYLLAGTVSVNPVLGMFGLFLVISWRVCGWFGVDRWLLPALGLPWKPGEWFQAGRSRAEPLPS